MTVSGKLIDSRMIGCFWSQRVSPVTTSFGADHADDAARFDGVGFDFLAVAGLDVPELADEFLLAGPGVQGAGAALEDAGVNANKAHVGVLVGGDLEDEAGERFVDVDLADRVFVLALFGFGVDAFDRRDVQRAGQVVVDPVEDRLDTAVVK